ncbi:MAG TPA: ATP-binding cassette domain-containing protein [Terracidiphilus sp.]
MVELALDARRGTFHLQVECRFSAEWTVVFGPSGSGKSTLLRLLAGLDRAMVNTHSRCRISLGNSVLADSSNGAWLRPGERQTALVAQQPALFPHLTVNQNVAYGLTHLHKSERQARVDEMLSLVDAGDLASRRPQHLSGGEAQRVALARALATRPRLLLLDEPFSALDGAASDTLLSRLQTWLPAHGVQTILATHDATDAFSIGAEVALLRDGKIIAQGPAVAVLVKERERLKRRLNESDFASER